ncbi:MAG: hypothetical protein AAGC88_16350, partial [Bacteroidota bacterium]
LLDDPILDSFKPKDKYHFDGNVYMLHNGGSRSATNTLLSLAEYYDAAVFIGREPGGMYEDVDGRWYVKFTLPYSGINVTFPAWTLKIDTENGDRTRGITPDYKIDYGFNDLQDGRDLEMEKALQLIQEANDDIQ